MQVSETRHTFRQHFGELLHVSTIRTLTWFKREIGTFLCFWSKLCSHSYHYIFGRIILDQKKEKFQNRKVNTSILPNRKRQPPDQTDFRCETSSRRDQLENDRQIYRGDNLPLLAFTRDQLAIRDGRRTCGVMLVSLTDYRLRHLG